MVVCSGTLFIERFMKIHQLVKTIRGGTDTRSLYIYVCVCVSLCFLIK